MTTAVFDTLKASDTLKAAGMEAKQAEAIVHTMAGAFEDTVATKSGLAGVKSDLKTEIGTVKADLNTEIANVKSDLKTEIGTVRAELKTEIAAVRAELKAEIAEVKVELKQDIGVVKGDIKLLKWMIGVVLACVAFPILKSFLT